MIGPDPEPEDPSREGCAAPPIVNASYSFQDWASDTFGSIVDEWKVGILIIVLVCVLFTIAATAADTARSRSKPAPPPITTTCVEDDLESTCLVGIGFKFDDRNSRTRVLFDGDRGRITFTLRRK